MLTKKRILIVNCGLDEFRLNIRRKRRLPFSMAPAYLAGILSPELCDVVIYDENNPRSLAFQLTKLEQHVARLPQQKESGSRTEIERLTLETATLIRLADVNRLAMVDETGNRRETLETFLNVLSTRLPALSDALTTTYFRTAETPHQLVSMRSRVEQ